MKKVIYSVFILGFIVSCSSGVGGDESIEPINPIEEYLLSNEFYNMYNGPLNKLRFNPNNTGFNGSVCYEEDTTNFEWQLDSNILIIKDGEYSWNSGSYEILSFDSITLEINSNIENIDDHFFGRRVWLLDLPKITQENWQGLNFKKLYTIVEQLYEGNTNFTDTTFFNEKNTYRFCDLDPYQMIENNTGTVTSWSSYFSFSDNLTTTTNITFNGKNLYVTVNQNMGTSDGSYYTEHVFGIVEK